MTIKAMSREHALQIFDELEAQGYTFKTSYLNIQEWVKEGCETVLVGKFYGYQRYRGLF